MSPISITAAGLPPGITLVDGARLAGIPTDPGTYIVSITASNALGTTQPVTFTLLVGPANGAPLIARPGGSDPSMSVKFGDKVSISILSAGQGPLTYSFQNLPAGLTASGATIKGTCYATAGIYNVPVTVTNSAGSDSITLTIYVIALPFSGTISLIDTYSTNIENDPDFGPFTVGNSDISATMTINLNGNPIEFADDTPFDIAIGNYSETFYLGDATAGTNKYTYPYIYTNDNGRDIPLGSVTLSLNTSQSNPTLTITISLNESDAMDFTQNFYVDDYLSDDPAVAIALTDTITVSLGGTDWTFNLNAAGNAPTHRFITLGAGDNATDLELISAALKGTGTLVP